MKRTKKTSKKVKKQVLKIGLIIVLVALIGFLTKNEALQGPTIKNMVHMATQQAIASYEPKEVVKTVVVAATGTLQIYNRTQVVAKIKEEASERGYSAAEKDKLIRLAVCESGLNQFFMLNNQDKKHSIDRGVYANNDKWHPGVTNNQAFDVNWNINDAFDFYDCWKKGGCKIETHWYCWPRVISHPEWYDYSKYN